MTVNGGRRGGLVLALVAAVIGVVLIVLAVTSQEPAPPQLDAPVGRVDATPTPTPSAEADRVRPAEEVPLGPSRPVSISIPAIGVSSELLALGKAPDGSLAVPQPGPNLDKAAWFENSPTPGQPGPAVIEGHVATEQSGPSVFFELAELRPGDKVTVERKDGSTVVFHVTALREFAKDRFPTELVYGGNVSEPTLRLITCSSFDPSIGKHTGNLVVFAELTNVRGA
ncbi:MAG TPA: class F sortase [Marmoricola sp.]|nr:class F sortase [Marmoricola sp.]